MGHIQRMVPNNVKALRTAVGLTQGELAEAIGTKLSMMGKLERGERPLDVGWLEKLAPHLKVAPYEIIAPLEAAGADTQPPASDTLSLDELIAILKAVREPLSKGPSTEADIQGLATMIYEILIYHRDHPDETRTPDMLFAAAHALVSRLALPPGASTPDKPDRS